MVKMKTVLKWSFIGLILLFIYFPIIFLTVYSFNESDTIQAGWTGFSLEHYRYFFNLDNEPMRVVLQTIALALIVALLSTILGTIGAIGIIGPCRMDYSKVLSTIDQLSEEISKLSDLNALPSAKNEESDEI